MNSYNLKNSNLASKINMIPYAKASIPIAAGDDFYAYIPVNIDTSVYKLICPILSDVIGDNCTKINISTCKWKDGQVYIMGNNQASGSANISLSGTVLVIK